MEKRILIIEDNSELRENLAETLELAGYEVTTAENGQVGVQLAQQQPPDLIICDVMMPKLDGYGVLNILSKKAATADIPFIFLTAKTEKADWRRGMNLGADDYITKPFFKDELLNVINSRLEKSQRLKKKFTPTADGWNAFIREAKGFDALRDLSADQRTRTYKKKEYLFLEGDAPRYLYLVKSGQVKLVKTNNYGKEYIIDTCGNGSFIGYTALIGDNDYSFTAVALETTEVSLIPKKDFIDLLYADRDVAVQLIKTLTHNVVEKEDQLLQLAYSSVRKRVANALLQIADKQTDNTIHVLRDDLAGMVGTARESVIRLLTEFKQDGGIEIVNGKITILNRNYLSSLPE